MIDGMASQTVQPFRFNDSGCSLTGLRFLFTQAGAQLKQIVEDLYAQSSDIKPGQIETLRKRWPRDAVFSALAVVRAGKKSAETAGKFPADSSGTTIWAVPEALEQATSRKVAQHKADKFRRCNPTAIIDYCCGIGGDMLALADVAPVLAVELSPVRALLAAHNAIQTTHRWPAQVIQADAATEFFRPQPGLMFHIDPARRIGSKRSAEYALMHPAPTVIERIISLLHDGAVKLSPAVDFSSLPDGHLELISENGVVVQTVLWTGRMAQPMESGIRTATVLSRGRSAWSLTGKPGGVDILHEPQQWVFEIDGAVLRAGLSAALCAALGIQPISADGGYATGPEAIDHPALTGFKIFGSLAYSQRAVAAALRSDSSSAHSRKKAVVEVKTRGGLNLDTDKLSKSLSACVTRNCTVLIYRGIHGTTAAIAERKIHE